MAYKIGFLCNFISHLSDKNYIIATYDNGHYTFKRVRPSILPRSVIYTARHFVLFKEAGDGDVSEVVFLFQIPVRFNGELQNEGLELYCPFLEDRETNNPCIKDSFCTKEHSSLFPGFLESSVYLNGIDLFPLPEFKIAHDFEAHQDRVFGIDSRDYLSEFFYRISIASFLLEKMCQSICSSFSVFTFRGNDDLLDKKYLDIIGQLKNYISTINIREIVSDLSITYDTYLGHKRGEGYYNDYFRTALVSSSHAKKDIYINKLIGYGRKYEGREDNYEKTSSVSLDGKKLEDAKREIIDSYSAEDHLVYLIGELLTALSANQSHYMEWKQTKEEYWLCLWEQYQLKRVNDRDFQKSFYPIGWSSCKDPIRILDEINQSVFDDSVCSFDNDVLFQLMIKRVERY